MPDTAIPYHLRPGAIPLAVCLRCGRSSWDAHAIGTEDQMTQPDGGPCGGRMVLNQRCGCGVPVSVYRNGGGHAPGCHHA